MMKITVLEGQTLTDIAVQVYGDPGAVAPLLDLNPELAASDPAFDISASLPEGTVLTYGTEGQNKKALKELEGRKVISE
ncbi:MAG: tail protein X [Candidatus Auribacterota bacterium]|jgi:hypothetical protein|nr:tail protein X [Candidatus Auribacterota bacterium]